MQSFFIVTWTGGYEAPQYASYKGDQREDAEATAADWARDARDGETVEMLELVVTTSGKPLLRPAGTFTKEG